MRTTVLLSTLSLAACDAGAGTLSVHLTDAPLDGVLAVNVPIDHVEVRYAHGGGDADTGDASDDGGWLALAGEPRVVNLLDYRDGATVLLAHDTVPAGTVTQIRLVLDDAKPATVVDAAGTSHDLAVPSGTASGLKLVGDTVIADGADTSITIDFDAARSVRQQHDDYRLMPVLELR